LAGRLTTTVVLLKEVTVRLVLPSVTVGARVVGLKSVPVMVIWVPAALTTAV
jgi:hypothetical protein